MVPAAEDTIDRFLLNKELNKDDFPVFGGPASKTLGLLRAPFFEEQAPEKPENSAERREILSPSFDKFSTKTSSS